MEEWEEKLPDQRAGLWAWFGWRQKEGTAGETRGLARIPPHSRGRWDGVGGARRMGEGLIGVGSRPET